MADQVTVDNGSLTDYTVSTDDAGASGQVQRVKLTYSADGSATHITADADGLLVNLGANNDVTITGSVTVADGGGSLTVDDGGLNISVDDGGGTLTVDNGTLSVVGGGTEATALRVTLASDSTGVLSVDDNGATLSVDDGGSSLTIDGTVSISGTVTVDSELPSAAALADNASNPTAPAVGAFNMVWDGATWDRAPGTSADGLLVNLGANNDVVVSDGGGSITVDGTVTANAGTGPFPVSDNGGSLTVDGSVSLAAAIPAGTNNIGDVDVLTLPQFASVTSAAQTSVTTSASQLLAANSSRKRFLVQNTGTTVIKLLFGSGSPTQTAYHLALAACSAADDGKGGTFVDDAWTGRIAAISSASGGTVVVTEITA